MAEEKQKKKKRIWDNHVVLYEIQKSDRRKIVVAASARDGFRCLNIREFYLRQRDGAWCPSLDGILIPLVQPLGLDKRRKSTGDGKMETITPLKDLMAVLPDAVEYISTMELSNPDNAVYI